MFQDFANLIIFFEFLGIQPYALSHEERKIVYMFFGLDLVAFHQLIDAKIHHVIQQFKEYVYIAV